MKVEEFVTTNESKREIIEYMIARVNEETVKLFDDEEQYREFSMYMMEILPSGKITYNGQLGVHDDLVMSGAIALHGISTLEKKGKYSVSVLSGAGNHRNRQKIRAKYQ